MIEIRHEKMYKTSDTQQAYDDLYSEGGIDLSDSYHLWILNKLKPKQGKLLVDISCGRGRLVHFASKMGVKALGLDFSKSAIRKSKALNPEPHWVVSDGERVSLRENCADYITHIGNLEHYQDPRAGIREVARLLKSDGIACILLPNGFSLLGNIKHVMKKGEVFDDGQPLQRYNTRFGWEKLLSNNGLEVYKTIRYEHFMPRTKRDWIAHLKRPTRLFRWFFAWLIPFNLSNCFVYFCHKSTGLNWN